MTTPNSSSVQARREVEALRLLREGATFTQVAERTGFGRSYLEQLVRDFPGPGRPAPAQRAPGTTTELAVRELAVHPANIRDDLGDLHELVDTINTHGVLQPLLVMRGEHGRYVVLDGHRRLAASIMAGLQRVPVSLRAEVDEAEATVIMLITGLQKLDLDPVDEAMAYQRLERMGKKPADIARLVGKNAGHISQRMALLNLTPSEQAAVRKREMTLSDAYKAGRDRSSRRRSWDTSRPKPKRVPHFTREHPLATVAAAACGHETTLKLGVACGPCWEQAIREDVLRVLRAAADVAQAVP